MVESAKISIARQDFKKSYERMSSTHLNRNFDGPKKRARVFDTYPTDLRQDQLQAVYKAQYEHSIAMITPQSKISSHEDYFTMPFVVLDKSIHTSGVRSKEFNLFDEK